MPGDLTNLGISGVLLAVVSITPASAKDIEEAFQKFMQEENVEAVCAFSQASDAERKRSNALVWAAGNNPLRALVFRVDIEPTLPAVDPCWAGPGRCAVFEGRVPAAPTACSSGRGFRKRWFRQVYGLYDETVADPALVGFAKDLMRLLSGIRADDTFVALLQGYPVYMSETIHGARRMRVHYPTEDIIVQRLRIALKELDVARLANAANRLGTREFALIGPHGALGRNDNMFLDGKCMEIASPSAVRRRLIAANDVFGLDSIPDTDPLMGAAYEDLVQQLLGGVVAHGRPIHFRLDQDPRLFLLVPGKTNLCP